MKALFIEAGHGKGLLGGADLGASGRLNGGKVYERDFAFRIASEVYKILKSKEELKGWLIQGVGIETTANIRKKMQYVNTVIKENHLDPDHCYGVAIHMNSSVSPKPSGFEIWHQKSERSRDFAKALCMAWSKYNISPLRPKFLNNSRDGRFGRFYIDDTKAKYVIVETGFVSNPEEAQKILDNIPRVAEAIAHGILEYLRINEK